MTSNTSASSFDLEIGPSRFVVSQTNNGNLEDLFAVDHEFANEITAGDAMWADESVDASDAANQTRQLAGPRIGRGQVRHSTLKTGQSIVIRQFLRGGLLATVNRQYFLFPRAFLACTSLTQSRPYNEMLALLTLRAQGVLAPRPLAVLVRRHFGLVYQGWLVTQLIPEAVNVLSLLNEVSYEELRLLIRQGGIAARKMLAAGVVHPDLHLGNLLQSPLGMAVVDFDKAAIVNNAQTKRCRNYLLQRFRRSALRHGLPELTFDFALGLED